MLIFTGSKENVAAFVADIVPNSKYGSPSIMITVPARLEVCSVRIVTDTSLEDIVKIKASHYCLRQRNT